MLENQNWKRSFFLVALGQAVSMLGSYGVQFALIWWLAERTSSPLMLGISGLAAYLPVTLLSPFAGVAADRFNRKWISIISDLSMGIAAALYAVALFYFDLPVWTVMVMLCLRGIGGTFQQPAVQSIIPQMVPKDWLVKSNGWIQLLNAGSFFLGPVIGAVLYAAFPLYIVLLSDVVGAVLASAALAVVKVPELEKRAEKDESIFRQFAEGFQIYREDKPLYYLVIGEALCMFFYAPLSSYYPLMTSDYFALSALHGSIVEMAFAAGMILSSLAFSSVLKVKNKIRASYIGLWGIGVATLICGLIPPGYIGWLFFSVTCLCMGAFGNVHTIPLTAYLQETVPPQKMGRAFSVLAMISSITMPVGLLVSSPIAEKVGVSLWFLISGVGMLAITLAVRLAGRLKAVGRGNDLAGD